MARKAKNANESASLIKTPSVTKIEEEQIKLTLGLLQFETPPHKWSTLMKRGADETIDDYIARINALVEPTAVRIDVPYHKETDNVHLSFEYLYGGVNTGLSVREYTFEVEGVKPLADEESSQRLNIWVKPDIGGDGVLPPSDVLMANDITVKVGRKDMSKEDPGQQQYDALLEAAVAEHKLKVRRNE